MNNIGIEFLSGTPNGPRRVFEANWSGECLMCSRVRIDEVLTSELFDVPGVYVLVGPSKVVVGDRLRFESELYIGQGDSVRDRIQSHLKKKEFWRTAIVFHRPHTPLNTGNIKFLESRLVKLAENAGNCVLNNEVAPQLPKLAKTETADTQQFLDRILFLLQALGFDFFAKQDLSSEEPAKEKGLDVPEILRRFIKEFKTEVLHLPHAEFYITKTPDFRAKVVKDNDFRVFARLKTRKRAFKLELKDVATLDLLPDDKIEGAVKDQLLEAYRKAVEYLGGRHNTSLHIDTTQTEG
ncbi:MAG TPA: GIY-YIG nuclease family protein [Candidatus Angelobacter sp.]|jgi:hypothetical protein|nr:GIY-YIG nuclease family protein [Candidatus Angelobacter sp.]